MPEKHYHPADEITVLHESQTRWAGFDLLAASDDIRRPTEWKIKEPRPIVIVHLGGRMDWLETEQAGQAGSLGPALPGECWMIPAGQRYTSRAHGATIDYAMLTLDPTPPASVRDAVSRPLHLTAEAARSDAFLHAGVLQMLTVARERSDLARMLGESLSAVLWLHLYREYGDRPAALQKPEKPGAYSDRQARRLRDFIHENLGESLSIEQLAGRTGQTTHQLLISFRATFGKTPWQYIIHERLRCAQWLLKDTTKDITTIALDAGFSSHSHLTSAFRKYLHCSPTEFRGASRSRSFPGWRSLSDRSP